MTVWGNNPNQPDHHPACVQHEDHPEFDVDLSTSDVPHYYVTGECTCEDILNNRLAFLHYSSVRSRSWADDRSYTDKVEELIHQVSFLSSRITKLENQLNNRFHSQPKKRRPESSVRKPLVGILDKKESNESVPILYCCNFHPSPNTNDIQ